MISCRVVSMYITLFVFETKLKFILTAYVKQITNFKGLDYSVHLQNYIYLIFVNKKSSVKIYRNIFKIQS